MKGIYGKLERGGYCLSPEEISVKVREAEIRAVAPLLQQAEVLYSKLKGFNPEEFYEFLKSGGNSEVRSSIIPNGPDKGKLTLEHMTQSGWVRDNRITPVAPPNS